MGRRYLESKKPACAKIRKLYDKKGCHNLYLFFKITAYSSNKFNNMADTLAKSALKEAKGIPKVKKGDFWFTTENMEEQGLLYIIEILEEEHKARLTKS